MKKIIILPCNGTSALGKITWLASQEMVLTGKAELCPSVGQLHELLETRGDDTAPCIIVDGCDKRCVFNELLEEGCICKYQLTLTDLGIAADDTTDITQDLIQRTKNGIVAECNPVVKEEFPPIYVGCGCG